MHDDWPWQWKLMPRININKNNDVYVRISGVELDYTNRNINIAQAAIAIPFEV